MRGMISIVIMLLSVISTGSVLAQTSAPSAKGKMDRLIVYGKDFVFGVKEPEGWHMKQYRREYPKAQFRELSASHADYKTFAKLVCVPGQFYEYVAYLNPGPRSKFTLSVAMSKQSNQATPEELKAFEVVLRSLIWLPKAAK